MQKLLLILTSIVSLGILCSCADTDATVTVHHEYDTPVYHYGYPYPYYPYYNNAPRVIIHRDEVNRRGRYIYHYDNQY